jgi:Flp pilus assembly pilin Flp
MLWLRTRAWCRLDRGGTALEYVLVMAVVALAIAVAVIGLGDVVENWFSTAAQCAGDIGECSN